MSQAEGGQKKARGLCASVERAIGATSWPIGKVVACLEGTNGDAAGYDRLRLLRLRLRLELMRSGLGTGQERRPGVCTCSSPRLPIHFFRAGQLCRFPSPEILDPHIFHNAQGRKAHFEAHVNASAQQHSEKVCREAKKAPQASKKRSSTFSRQPLRLEY
jgi:hypothetical protein